MTIKLWKGKKCAQTFVGHTGFFSFSVCLFSIWWLDRHKMHLVNAHNYPHMHSFFIFFFRLIPSPLLYLLSQYPIIYIPTYVHTISMPDRCFILVHFYHLQLDKGFHLWWCFSVIEGGLRICCYYKLLVILLLWNHPHPFNRHPWNND